MDLKELAVLTNQLVKKAASEDDESFLYQYRVPISLIAGGLAGAALGTKYAPFLKRKLGKILQFGKTKAKSKTRKAKTRKAKTKTETKAQAAQSAKKVSTKTQPKTQPKRRRSSLKAFLEREIPGLGITNAALMGILTRKEALPALVSQGYITERHAKKIAKVWDILRQKGKLKTLPKYEEALPQIKSYHARNLIAHHIREVKTSNRPLKY